MSEHHDPRLDPPYDTRVDTSESDVPFADTIPGAEEAEAVGHPVLVPTVEDLHPEGHHSDEPVDSAGAAGAADDVTLEGNADLLANPFTRH